MRVRRPAVEGPGRPAFYALRPGGWRDWWTLLHPPYTLWHLSYVAIGAATAPAVLPGRLAASLLAFFLAVGVGAHALDELAGRPLGTRIRTPVLGTAAAVALAAAVAVGVVGAARVSWWLLAFVGFGAFVCPAYNLEWWGRRFHSDVWFALAWGGFPALTGAFAQTASIRPAAVLAAAACALVSMAQRLLSTPVRRVRREVADVMGTVVYRDGRSEALGLSDLREPAEGALRVLSAAVPLLATALVAARLA